METQQLEIEQLKERVCSLETRLAEMRATINEPKPELPTRKDWRSIVGISANDPFFDQVVAAGAEWRRTSQHDEELDLQW